MSEIEALFNSPTPAHLLSLHLLLSDTQWSRVSLFHLDQTLAESSAQPDIEDDFPNTSLHPFEI